MPFLLGKGQSKKRCKVNVYKLDRCKLDCYKTDCYQNLLAL